MKHSAMQSMDAAAMINDYEQLRAASLASRCSPGTHPWLKRLVGEGLYAWLMTRNSAQSHDQALASINTSSPSAAVLNQHDAIVQLLASMTLRSIIGH